MEQDLQLYRQEAATTFKALEQTIQWKPGKAADHLEKRKRMGHLAANVSLEEYNALIQALIRNADNQVYLYHFGFERYYAVRGIVQTKEWLVIATREGVVETAFPPDTIDQYLEKRGFLTIGTISEVVS